MKKIFFSKYSGCGNDFILIDNRKNLLTKNLSSLAQILCHRQNGIGADGLILLDNSYSSHFKMRIFNSDGSEAEMCGNGIRCLAQFIHDLHIEGTSFSIETMHRALKISLVGDHVSVDMGDPKEIVWNLSVGPYEVHHLDTGVPHAVTFVQDIQNIDVNKEGSFLRNHSQFKPRGANANFAFLDKENTLHVRTFERGVEQETLACGTGVTAAALAASKVFKIPSPIQVKVRSQEVLLVDFFVESTNFTSVKLIGPAKHIFDGSIDLPYE